MIVALDTETTGLDFYHGTRPFLVTTCDEEGNQEFWEWDVDPLTRRPIIPKLDLKQIREAIDDADELVLQNAKFDVAALRTVMGSSFDWPWEKTHDTLLSGHLLKSNQPHDLTTMTLVYLGINVQPYEERIKKACNDARRLAKKEYSDWQIAAPNRKDMPSAKGTPWKYDMWLPRSIAIEQELPEDHEWRTLCSEYANVDSSTTIALFLEHKKLLKKQGLWDIYEERLKMLPIVYGMEKIGVTLSGKRLHKQTAEYQKESSEAGKTCLRIARSFRFDLELPKSGNNKSLTEFVFDVMELEPYKRSKKTGAPSLDKEVMDYYVDNLEEQSREGRFIKNLIAKRKRDTALAYMDGYRKFWLPLNDKHKETKDWYVIHPSLNPTGTDTLRWSSSNPNEQNISKKEGFNLRYSFGPSPGREWWALDYDNLELKIPAYEADEREMIDLFEKPDEAPFFGSYHLFVASILHHKKWQECLKDGVPFKKKYPVLYGKTKNGNFANQYGAVVKADGWGTADKAYGVRGGQKKVQARLNKITKLNQKMIVLANKNSYIETMPDKDVDGSRGYPLYCSRNNWRQIKPTIPLNYHVQGTACWIMMRAMIEVQDYLDVLNRKFKEGYHMILQVHDEILIDFPQRKARGNLSKVKRVQRLMESVGSGVGIPLSCGIEYHPNNWSESK